VKSTGEKAVGESVGGQAKEVACYKDAVRFMNLCKAA
jgi:hypothetical protein